MKSILCRVTLLLGLLTLATGSFAFERKPEWERYHANGADKRPAQASTAATAAELKTNIDKVSYSIGLRVAESIKVSGIPVKSQLIAKAIDDSLGNEGTALSLEEAQAILDAVQRQIVARQQQELERMARRNLKRGQEFLSRNASRPEVTVTASGLQYEVLVAGSGPQPQEDDIVTLDYRGSLIDGTVFDTSFDNGGPYQFSVNGILPGWTEALTQMPVGARWKLYLPADLAYGEQGAPPVIEPNSVLIFEIELHEIAPK